MHKAVKNISNEKTPEQLQKYIPEFLIDRKQELSSMKTSFENENYEEIRKISHKWKSFCGPYGFDGLGELAIELEKNAASKNKENVSNLLEVIELYLVKKEEVLKLDE